MKTIKLILRQDVASLGEAGALVIDIAIVDGMADFHERQQHSEQDGGGFHRPQRRVIAAASLSVIS